MAIAGVVAIFVVIAIQQPTPPMRPITEADLGFPNREAEDAGRAAGIALARAHRTEGTRHPGSGVIAELARQQSTRTHFVDRQREAWQRAFIASYDAENTSR